MKHHIEEYCQLLEKLRRAGDDSHDAIIKLCEKIPKTNGHLARAIHGKKPEPGA